MWHRSWECLHQRVSTRKQPPVIVKKVLLLNGYAAFGAIRVYALAPNHKFVAIATFFLLSMPGLIILVCVSVAILLVRSLPTDALACNVCPGAKCH